MGLRANILKPSYGDCSNGGISSRADHVTIVNVEGPFEPTDDAPAVMLVPGNVAGSVKLIEAEPFGEPFDEVYVEARPWGALGPMMGGCYVSTPDTRFLDAVEALVGHRDGAVPLHDRFETAKQYEALSV